MLLHLVRSYKPKINKYLAKILLQQTGKQGPLNQEQTDKPRR